MDFKEIQDLIKLINKSNLTEFKMKKGDFQLSIRTKKYGKWAQQSAPQQQILPISAPVQTVVPQAPAAPVANSGATPGASADAQSTESAKDKEPDKAYLEIRSPMVGTFYRSPKEDQPAYVEPGDTINIGDTVCIVEAMKLFNEIESEVSGKIVKVIAENASPVEYDQVLFLVEPL